MLEFRHILGSAVLVSLVMLEYTYNACSVSAMAQCDQPPMIAVDPTDACDDVIQLAADIRNECSDDTPIINELLCFMHFYLKRAPKTKISDVEKRHFFPDEVALAKECLCTTFGDNISRKLKNIRNTVNKMKSEIIIEDIFNALIELYNIGIMTNFAARNI